MISIYIIFILISYSSLVSTRLIKTYRNARFEPYDNQSIISTLYGIISQDFCICQCLMNETCLTIMYTEYYQFCILYRVQLNDGQLRVTTMQINSNVMIIRNKTMSDPTTSSLQTTIVTTAVMTTAVVTCTTLVNFDDIPGQATTSGIIPNTYKNLNWTNAGYINTSLPWLTGGYLKGVRSRPFVMHNLPGMNITLVTANGTRFSFDGLRLTSAYRENLMVIVKTIRNTLITSVGNFTLTTSYRTPIHCDFCKNVDKITFESQGGISNPNYSQNGTEFIVDDLCISFGR